MLHNLSAGLVALLLLRLTARYALEMSPSKCCSSRGFFPWTHHLWYMVALSAPTQDMLLKYCLDLSYIQTGIGNYIPYILAFFTITLSPFSNCSLEIPRNPSPTCSVLYPQPFAFRSFVCTSTVVILDSKISPFAL